MNFHLKSNNIPLIMIECKKLDRVRSEYCMLSYSDIIKDLLGIQDKNIIIEDNCKSEEVINGIRTHIIDAKLIGEPSANHCCTDCEHSHIIKHGFLATYCLLPKPSSQLKTLLRLRKQRWFCKSCKATSISTTPLVDYRCTISNPLKMHIFHDATKKRSEVEIAYDNGVSNVSVNRIVNAIYEEKQVRLDYLPEVLCFDEFKSTKDAKGAMSFIFCNADNGKIIDILEERTLEYLKGYFRRFTLEARKGVKEIVIDMYSAYMSLINSLFPNAKIVTDRFHIVQLISRALNKTRIKIMNTLQHTDEKAYRKLKRYWKLLLKYSEDLDDFEYKFFWCFAGKKTTQKKVVEEILTINEQLRISYEFYQELIHAIKTKNPERLTRALQTLPKNISDYLKTSAETLIAYLPSVTAALETKYSNGILEGIINQIKVIKRIAFGYRSFVRFKARILMIHEYNPIKIARKKKQKEKEQSKLIPI